MSARVLVCGGREYRQRARVWYALDQYHAKHGPIEVVIHGCARGADLLAKEWAHARGIAELPFLPDWKGRGKAAGPIRNQQMLDEGRPTVVIAFPGGNGTADMVRRAREAGITTHVLPA